ncbi:site-specific integrase [Desulfotignum balticum]|uniref:site-specific integrase n=3 Tax=Desulfotignum balticum TaxID=115781 RepID=UPI0003F7093C|nr:site-specific integrase [Desulfotignum balticum]
MDRKAILLIELVDRAKKQLDLLCYAESTKHRYIGKWKQFLVYAQQQNQLYFSKEIGEAFLKDCYGIQTGSKLSANQVFKARAVDLLDGILQHGCFPRCRQKPGIPAPQQFLVILEKYKKLQFEKGISRKTVLGKKIILVRFLNYLDIQGIADIRSLTSYEILSYLHTLKEYRSNSKSGIMFALRDFLLFLYSKEYVREPLNDLFHTIFTNKLERLPSYYSADEMNAILCQVDRDSEFGRRDYLVLLSAIQLGLRAGDIRQLKLENIKLDRNTIELIQQKTNNLLQLPLTEEFKYALADYMKNSRPKVDDPHIFVRHRAPFQPFAENNSFYHVINKHMTMADIALNNRKHGLHSMRHSIASCLLQGSTPYPVIAGILGHKSTSTTKFYLRIDIQQLRTVALEAPDGK